MKSNLKRSLARRSSLAGVLGILLASGMLAACQNMTRLNYLSLHNRAGWQRPCLVIEKLDVKKGDLVADVGAGKGYFTYYLAEEIGADGRVYAVELDEEKLTELRAGAADRKLGMVKPIQGATDSPRLPEAVDLILIVNTYHHIENRRAYFQRLSKSLRPGGRIAILEPRQHLTGLLSLFLDEGHWSDAAQVRTEMESAGYREAANHDVLAIQHFLVFEPGG